MSEQRVVVVAACLKYSIVGSHFSSSFVFSRPVCHDREISFGTQHVSGGDVCHSRVEIFENQSLTCHTFPSPASRGSIGQLFSRSDCGEQGSLPTSVGWE